MIATIVLGLNPNSYEDIDTNVDRHWATSGSSESLMNMR